MRIQKYILVIALSLGIACDKYNDLKNDDPLTNADRLYGRLFLTDTFTQRKIDFPLAKKTVTVSYSDSPDSLNYIYSTTTNDEGYFEFKNLSANRRYRLRYEEVVNGVLYMAQDTSNVPNEGFILHARLSTPRQQGVAFTVRDTLGNALTGAEICVFTSPIPYNNTTCDGSSFTLKTDEWGHASHFNMTSGQYYMLSRITINGTQFLSKGTFTITDQVEYPEIRLAVPSAAITNGLNVTVMDISGNVLKDVRICLFTSPSLYERDTCENSSYSAITAVNGKTSFTGLIQGKYYVLGDLSLTNFRMIGRDTVDITDKIIADTIYMKRR